MRSERGFTLPELVAAIALMIILVAISVLWLRPVDLTAQNRSAQRQLHIATIAQALVKYRAANQHFPEGIPKEFTEIGSVAEKGYDLCTALVPIYLKRMPLEPQIGVTYKNGSAQSPSGDPCDKQEGLTYLSGYYIKQNPDGGVELESSEAGEGLVLPEQ
ncbi:MAG TPA: type II secretion system protein [Candidatus Saccharimonadales bacterium]